MGRILKIDRFHTPMEVVILVVGLCLVLTGVWFYAPGIMGMESLVADELALDTKVINNLTPDEKIALPSTTPSLAVTKTVDGKPNPEVIIAGYAWNGEKPIITANGGPRTTKGSLMELAGVNLTIVRQDWLADLTTMLLKFVEQYDNGQEFPSSNKAAFAIMQMGDGAPYTIATVQTALAAKYPLLDKDGEPVLTADGRPDSRYHVKVIGAMGMSDGEDKLIGPREWKTWNPSKGGKHPMLGSLISTVPGDGDWVVLLNYCFANNLKVNPDFSTYDADAVNIFPSKDDDYIESAKELIASQENGFKVTLDVVENGKRTGETIDKLIDGCATWTPGDKMVFDALGGKGFTDIASTADFPNQMATTIIAIDEWAMEHEDIVINILKASLTAANQLKMYDDWAVTGSEAVAATFKIDEADGKYWYDMFKGQTGSKNGNEYNMGGTRVLNYADVMQYYGEGDDRKNRYKSVYDQVSNYLTTLNPFDFNTNVDGIVPYDDAVNLYFLKNMEGMVQTTDVVEIDYSEEKTTVMAQGQWKINFATGSANIQATSYSDIETIYGLLMQAEQTKIKIIGHTDNTGNANKNMTLSDSRANSVADALLKKGIDVSRFQVVNGKGQEDPIADNNTNFGRSQNRRVEIVLLK